MSTDSKDTFKPNASQGDFWGGYMTEAWLYKFLAYFPITGFLGVDKFLLRSPFTAILKFLINVFFLGAWYIYDCIQLRYDYDFVGKYGFSNPYGVSGHGYRLLGGISTHDFQQPSAYNGGVFSSVLYFLFIISTFFVGFTGLPMMLAGDFYGGLIKMFSNVLILPFFFYLFNQVLDFFKSSSLEKDGVPHPWPMYPLFTIFEKYPATNLLSEKQAKIELDLHTAKYKTDITDGKLPDLPALFMSTFSKAYQAATVFPAVAAFDTITAGKGAVKAASNTLTDVAEVADDAVDLGKQVVKELGKELKENPKQITNAILGKSSLPIKQEGGGNSFIPEEFDTIMLMGMGVLIFGGLAAALLRKFALPRRQEDDEYPRKVYERDDAPPKPGGV